MAECYLCGTYIPRGQGFRRVVQTGSSQRVYVGRRMGSSSGVSQGLRTVCHTCARIMDERNEGSGLRSVVFLALCALTVFLGYRVLAAEHGFLGLIVMAIGPIIWGVFESQRNKDVAARIIEEDFPSTHAPAPSPAPIQTPKLDTEDDNSAGLEALKGYFCAGDFESLASAIQEGEELTDWCKRTATAFPPESELGYQEIYDLLISCIQFSKPRPKIPVADWFQATLERIDEIKKAAATVDLFGPSSGKQKGETNARWLNRVGPFFLNVKEGQSKDDAIETLIDIAAKEPPREGESVMLWVDRVKHYIDEHNATEDR